MATPLHVVILEDQPADAELMVYALRQAGFDPDWQRVDTAEEFLGHLEPAPDVILADHSLPRFSAFDCLRWLQEKGLDIPCIVVTGTLSDEQAVESIRLGAADYLLKDRLGRLGSAVQRALDDRQVRAEKRRAEEALRESEERYRSLADTAPIGIFETDAGDQCVYANQRLAEISGLTVAEHLGDGWRHSFHPDDLEATLRSADSSIQTGRELISERRLVRPDGTTRWVRIHVLPRRSPQGEVLGMVGAVTNITEERLAAEEIRNRAQQQAAVAELGQRALATDDLSSVMDNAVALVARTLDVELGEVLELLPDGSALQPRASVGWDRDSLPGTLVAVGVNSQAGYTLLTGQPVIVNDLPTETRFGIGARLRARGVVSGLAVTIPGIGGPFGVLSAHATSRRAFSQDDVHFLQTVANVLSSAIQRHQAADALQKSEHQLRQSQKMEAVGMLAGGVAHDFNNLLTAIIGFSSLVIDDMPPDDPKVPFMQQIAAAGERAATLTRQLLTFSRQEVQELELLDLNTVVTDIEKLLRRVIGEDVDLASVLDLRLGQLQADRGQIEQIIMNLAVNARDAMPTGGKLTITTANIERDEAREDESAAPRVGRYIMLSVSDTGTGMDAETQARAFEPFFTTKELGKGTGLGLATVYGIVTQSHGEIEVYSELGHGTSFKIYLPRVDEAMEDDTPPTTPAITARGSELILLVEDEDGVRTLASTVLELPGYHVLRASGGEEALAICRSSREPIDLIITDVVMPGMNGADLALQAVEVCPEAKILFMSGYPGEVAVRHGVLSSGTAYLAKPFSPSEIARKVREVLDDAGGDTAI